MKKFIKLPSIIEAIQFTGDNYNEIVEFTKGNAEYEKRVGGDENGYGLPQLYERITITTIHDGQKVLLAEGDWVIPEPDGKNFYPCKDNIFKRTYAPYVAVLDNTASLKLKIKQLQEEIQLLKIELSGITGGDSV